MGYTIKIFWLNVSNHTPEFMENLTHRVMYWFLWKFNEKYFNSYITTTARITKTCTVAGFMKKMKKHLKKK